MQCNASLHVRSEILGKMKIAFLLPSEMPLAWLGDRSQQHAVPAGPAAPQHMIASQLALPLHAPPTPRICISDTLDISSHAAGPACSPSACWHVEAHISAGMRRSMSTAAACICSQCQSQRPRCACQKVKIWRGGRESGPHLLFHCSTLEAADCALACACCASSWALSSCSSAACSAVSFSSRALAKLTSAFCLACSMHHGS